MDGSETHAHRLKRLRHRSRQRGFNEMDQILGSFAAAQLAGLSPGLLDQYEALLDIPDWDAFGWIAGGQAAPPDLAGIVREIRKELPA